MVFYYWQGLLRQILVPRVGCYCNKYLNIQKQLWNWAMGRGWKSFEVCARNIDVKGNFGEISAGNEEHVIGNWSKGDPSYKVAKNLAKMCSTVL